MAFFRDLEDTLSEQTAQGAGDDVDQVFDAVVEEEERQVQLLEAESRALSEVEARLYKANLYRLVLDNPLFPGESGEEAAQVEQEYREFTLKQLNTLMGIRADEETQDGLDPEETRVLKIWAKKLLNKPTVLAPIAVESRPPPVMASVTVPLPSPRAPRPPTLAPKRVAPAQAPKTVRQKTAPVVAEDQDGVIHKGGKKFVRHQGRSGG